MPTITFDDKDISTQYTALMSKVMTNGNGRIKFQLTNYEVPKKSQIEEYLEVYNGPGCQHIAIATDDIKVMLYGKCREELSFCMYQKHIIDTSFLIELKLMRL